MDALNQMNRREFMEVIGITAVAFGASQHASAVTRSPQSEAALNDWAEREYNRPLNGQFRVIHLTDTHAQLKPIYYREPNVNLGIGDAYNRMPHLVGDELMKQFAIRHNTNLSYAYTYKNFDQAAQLYGKVGGYSHIATVMKQLREAAGGSANTITLDGGDTWHGSAEALWTRGMCMVEASNLLGIDFFTGHWEFTYHESEVLKNLGQNKSTFLAQNVRVKEEALMSDDYYDLVDSNDGLGLYDEETGHAFEPYQIKEVNGYRVAIIGQAFPRTANANPAANFPNWSFGLRLDDLQALVQQIRDEENPVAVILLSHNGMDVDIKLASQISGIDAIFGGHTHDAMPAPMIVENASGKTFVVNSGSNGKYLGVMDFEVSNGQLSQIHFNMLPIFSDFVKADEEMERFINELSQRRYDEQVVESRRPEDAFNLNWVGKTYEEILTEPLGIADRTLYRRGNFAGTWDQLIVDALRSEYSVQLAFSPGVRWGTSIPAGESITMRNVMDQTSMTYGETYQSEMTGAELKTMLEGVAENLFNEDPYLQSGGDMVRVGGLDFVIDPTQSFGERISELRLDSGEEIQMQATYTTSGWAQVNQVGEGRLIWNVVADYIRQNGTALSKFNQPKVNQVNNNKGMADYNPSI